MIMNDSDLYYCLLKYYTNKANSNFLDEEEDQQPSLSELLFNLPSDNLLFPTNEENDDVDLLLYPFQEEEEEEETTTEEDQTSDMEEEDQTNEEPNIQEEEEEEDEEDLTYIPTNNNKCPMCNRMFSRKFNLKVHIETHKKRRARPFVCQKCKKSFLRTADLNRHNQNVHINKKKLTCQYCTKMFSRRDAVDRHIRKFHV